MRIIDEKAMLIDVYNGTSKGGKPFTIAKVLFSGCKEIASVFVETGLTLPEQNSFFAVQTFGEVRGGSVSVVFNKDTKFGKVAA